MAPLTPYPGATDPRGNCDCGKRPLWIVNPPPSKPQAATSVNPLRRQSLTFAHTPYSFLSLLKTIPPVSSPYLSQTLSLFCAVLFAYDTIFSDCAYSPASSSSDYTSSRLQKSLLQVRAGRLPSPLTHQPATSIEDSTTLCPQNYTPDLGR